MTERIDELKRKVEEAQDALDSASDALADAEHELEVAGTCGRGNHPTSHGLRRGDFVEVSNSGSNQANGVFRVASVTARSFSYTLPDGTTVTNGVLSNRCPRCGREGVYGE